LRKYIVAFFSTLSGYFKNVRFIRRLTILFGM
jgi:hypothetical protein